MFVRSEFSFRTVFGPMEEVVARLPAWGGVITDPGAWGHVPFAQACAKAGKKAVLGSRFFAPDRSPIIIVPRSPAGLQRLYGAIAAGEELAPERVAEAGAEWAVIVQGPSSLAGAVRMYAPGVNRPAPTTALASSDNLYPLPRDRQAWALMLGKAGRQHAGSRHILTPAELRMEGAKQEWIDATRRLVEECETPLPKAENIRFPVADPDKELAEICRAEMSRRGLSTDEYTVRLSYELKLIAEKKFADYFLVIWDLLRYAKAHMLVGPARGSSAGSLVCWLTRITEIDPLRFGLIFERFIDVNRFDLPDIDIDFPDSKRHMILSYLQTKYGEANVAHVGNVLRYKAKSALTDVAKSAGVPLFELDKLKDVLIEYTSGDARAGNSLEDSMRALEVGRELLAKYPLLNVATRVEEHARTCGVHASGLIVCNEPVSQYCGMSADAAQIDKKMAVALNMLKIDALGLRTLSVIEECCALAGVTPATMYDVPLEDPATFALLNAGKFSGIFQYEGIALQSVAKQIRIDCFDDVAAITALARPGPLSGGETNRWILGKNSGRGNPLHPALQPYTEETFGTILYQEQVMMITRQLGGFSWADTAKIRKLMSDRKGNEAFGKFEENFLAGAVRNGMAQGDAARVWKAINSFGSWAFNKSHAVAYGLVSYWTAWLKVHHPLPFAVANLRHARDEESTLVMLRELLRDNPEIVFSPVDPLRSTLRWEFADNKLIGPLTGIDGVGPAIAEEILRRRTANQPFTPRQQKLLTMPSKYADHSPAGRMWADLYAHPERHFKTVTKLYTIAETEGGDRHREFAVLGRLIKKNLRDLNDDKYLVKRNGKRVPENARDMLLFNIEDDSGRLLCCVNARNYKQLGAPIVERAALGQWLAVKGKFQTDFKMLSVEAVKWL